MLISVTKGWTFCHYRPQGELAGFTVALCLKLAVMFIERHSLRDCTELICLSIKLFFTSIHQWEIGQEKEIERQKECAIGQLLEKLRLKAADDFRFAYHSQRERLTKELQVWDTSSALSKDPLKIGAFASRRRHWCSWENSASTSRLRLQEASWPWCGPCQIKSLDVSYSFVPEWVVKGGRSNLNLNGQRPQETLFLFSGLEQAFESWGWISGSWNLPQSFNKTIWRPSG